MRIGFTKKEEGYVAEYSATDISTLSVKRTDNGTIDVYVKPRSGFYFKVFSNLQNIEKDFVKILNWATYPVSWRIVSSTPVESAFVDFND